MSYSVITSGINSPQEIIDQLATFAAADGWTIHRNVLAGSNRTLTVRKSGSYVHIYNTTQSEIRIIASTGYAAVSPPSETGTAPSYARSNFNILGPYSRVFFMGGDEYIQLIAEIEPGLVRMLSFGEVRKLDAWTGGTYFDATEWTISSNVNARGNWTTQSHALFGCDTGSGNRGYVQITVDGKNWAGFNSGIAASYHRARTGVYAQTNGASEGDLATMVNTDLNPFSGRRIGFPIDVFVTRPGGLYYPVGHLPDVRFINIQPFDFGQEVQDVDTLTWKMFPMVRKGSNQTAVAADYSGNYGYSFLKLT